MRLLLYSFLLLTLAACASSRQHMVKGHYDRAIEISVRKLSRKPTNEKEIITLEKSFLKANELDQERVQFLRMEGKPDMWNELYSIYNRMKSRQTLVRKVTPLTIPTSGRVVEFPYINYDEEIIQAKQKSAEFFYTSGKLKLERGGRENARAAYQDFLRAKQYYPGFRDLDVLTSQALELGVSHVLFRMENKSGAILPAGFQDELLRINLAGMDSRWLRFHTSQQSGVTYPYVIKVNIRQIDVSPERIHENSYAETKEIQDGFTYILDKNGNVMKDSLGNDIKVPRMVSIQATVFERHLTKAAIVSGTIDFLNAETGQTILSEPIIAETFFDNKHAMARGNLDALSPLSKKKLSQPALPFPPDFEMLLQCGEILKGVSRDIISANQRHFQ